MPEYGEARFEVSFSPTKELILEMQRAFLFSGRSLCYLALGLLPLYEAGKHWHDVIQWNQDGFAEYAVQMIPWAIYWTALLLAVVAVWYFMPALYARRYMNQVREMYGGFKEVAIAYRFYEDKIRTEGTTGTKMEVEYGQIIRVKETEHLILLKRKKNLVHMLEKDKFIRGDLPDFRAFLMEKMPDGKFRWQ